MKKNISDTIIREVIMENIGEYLKEEREKKNITIEQISRDTKISKSVLYAIESESFEDLPGGFFNIGILRTYAKYIGVDDKKVVSEYKKRYENTPEKPFLKEITKERIGLHLNKKILIIAFLLIILIFAMFWFFGSSGISNKDVIAIGKTLKKTANTDTQIKKNIINKKEDLKKTPAKEAISYKKQIKNKTLNIVLYFNDQCWIEIKKGGNIIVSRLFQQGEKYSASGIDFTVKLGNPSAAKIIINGKKGFINSKPGIPITFNINLDNYKQYLRQ